MNGLKIYLDGDRCVPCGICVGFCPQSVFNEDEVGRPYVDAEEACTGCGLCEQRCPDLAIRVEYRKAV